MATSDYEALKARLARGWNTWNVRSVLSHVRLPSGFALNLAFKDLKHTSYLKEAYIAREDQREERVHPGIRSYDGSYTELNVKWKDLDVTVQSGTDGDNLVLLVTPHTFPKATPSLVVEAGILGNRPGHVSREAETLIGHTPDGEIRAHATEKPIEDPHVPAQGPYLVLPMAGPLGITTGRPRGLDEIHSILAARKFEQDARAQSFGDLADLYSAVQTCLAWDTIYEPSENRVISPVSRIWSVNMGGYVLYCWDVYFAAYIAALDNRDLAYANAVEMTRERTERGFVPNFAQAGGLKSRDRSEPCVGALVARELYRRFGDRWFLEEIYDGLLSWNRWWHEHRSNQGLLSWGSDPYEPIADYYWESAGVNALYGAALESGLDNSPMYDDIPFDSQRHLMQLSDVGLTGLYVRDCDSLADIAQILGKDAEVAELRSRAEAYRHALAGLWDEATGMFLNRRTDTGESSRRISPTNFYALLAGAATPEQAGRMVKEHLYNPNEFWGDWIMPSIARNDPAYPEQNYWRGRIWPPMNFLAYLSLRGYDLPQARRDLAEKSAALLMNEWRAHGYVCENYSGDAGAGGEIPTCDRFYHWGGLLGLIAFIEAGILEAPEKPLENGDCYHFWI